jgi:DNA-binding MarR family transcriptional regulator
MTTPAAAHSGLGSNLGERDECSSPDEPDEIVSAWMCIARCYKHVTRVLGARVEQETGLAVPSFLVLSLLLRSGEQAVPLSTLAREVAFTSGGFTKVADRLEQAGLIARQPSPCDRRVTNAVLTPAGREAAERAVSVYYAGLRELVVPHLGADGLQALAGQMMRLSADLPPEG